MPYIINFMIRSNCPESYNDVLDSYIFNLRKYFFRIFPQVSLKKKATVQF